LNRDAVEVIAWRAAQAGLAGIVASAIVFGVTTARSSQADPRPYYCTADTYNRVLPGLERVADEVDASRNLEANVGLRDRHLRGASSDFAKDAELYGAAVEFMTDRLKDCTGVKTARPLAGR
jgi:hypothetical protein